MGWLPKEEVGQGTLFMNWSESPVNGAIAFFKPGKKVGPCARPTVCSPG